jgi:hypothetical protein
MKQRLLVRWYRLGTWGDRKHWEVTIGRLNISRWCASAPCHLPGYERSRHWVSLRLWRGSWYRPSRTARAAAPRMFR